jgi:hypothetical protein
MLHRRHLRDIVTVPRSNISSSDPKSLPANRRGARQREAESASADS